MNKVIPLFFIVFFLSTCQPSTISKKETVEAYYQAFDDSDFQRIKALISDSLVIIEGTYETAYTKESFYKQFKWDSVFQTTYAVIEIEENENAVFATVSSSSSRYAFLKNNPLTSKFKISFKDEKISKIELVDYVDADFSVWEKEREALVGWIKSNHPELDGFIYDLSMQGALNYLKAIEAYENR